MAQIFSVSELTHHLKHILESRPELSGVQVEGEVSNLTYHGSGHVYFVIKDAKSQLKCVMFRSYAQRNPRIKEGDRIIAQGDMTLYPPRGNYQLQVYALQQAGIGKLYQEFIKLKTRLQQKGWFESHHKKTLPSYPQHIAVISSPTGAALRDVIRTVQRRYNRGTLTLIPAIVQGSQGASSLVRALSEAETLGADVLILARGGGSLEDLWNFNEERVAQAVFECSLPVVSGIGHETDFTIVDFVADLRASTPTAAAEHAVPDLQRIYTELSDTEYQLQRALQHYIDVKRQLTDDYAYRLQQQIQQLFQAKRHTLQMAEVQLDAMNPKKLLDQGYTLTLKAGKILRSIEEIERGERIETIFKDGRINARVE